jgi:hypothetical protein
MMDLTSIIAEPARGGEAPAPLGQSRGVIEAHECISQASAHAENIGVARALAALDSRCDARLPDGAPRKR